MVKLLRHCQSAWKIKRWLYKTFWVFLNRIFFRQSSTICAWVTDVNTTDYSNWQSKQLNSASYSCDYPCVYYVGAAGVMEEWGGGVLGLRPDKEQVKGQRKRFIFNMGQHAIGLSFRNSGFFDRIDQPAVRAHSLLVIGTKASSLQGYCTKFSTSVQTIGVGLTYSSSKGSCPETFAMGNPLARKRDGLAQCVHWLLMGWTTSIWFLASFVYRMVTGAWHWQAVGNENARRYSTILPNDLTV